MGRLGVAGGDQVKLRNQMQAASGLGASNMRWRGVMSLLTTGNLI